MAVITTSPEEQHLAEARRAQVSSVEQTEIERLRGGSGDGRKLVTLRDPALYVTKLPEADHDADV